jgi:antitoxin HicB
MKQQKVTKAALARQMKTSRAQLDRLLDPDNQLVAL